MCAENFKASSVGGGEGCLVLRFREKTDERLRVESGWSFAQGAGNWNGQGAMPEGGGRNSGERLG